jgi:hypothetical protein
MTPRLLTGAQTDVLEMLKQFGTMSVSVLHASTVFALRKRGLIETVNPTEPNVAFRRVRLTAVGRAALAKGNGPGPFDV